VKKLTDKNAIRVALNLAIDYEESLIDSYRTVPEQDPERQDVVERAQKRIDAFKRVLQRYYGVKYQNPLLKDVGKPISLMSLLKGPGDNG